MSEPDSSTLAASSPAPIDPTAVQIEEILPHRPPMLLVREVVEVQSDRASCAGWIDDDSPFALDGHVTVQLALELAAQSAAVTAACLEMTRRGGVLAPRSGYLATLRNVRFETPTVATGVKLIAEIVPQRSLGGLSLYQARVRAEDGAPILEGAFSVSSSPTA